MNRLFFVFVFISTIVLIDQSSKIWVKTNMEMGYGGQIFISNSNFVSIYLIEATPNSNFFFGKKTGSILRIVVLNLLVFTLLGVLEKNPPRGLIIGFSLILAGAIGNTIDITFYGEIFSGFNNYQGGFLEGRIVDMIYIDFWTGYVPEWVPKYGGQYYALFPITNFASISITIGLIIISMRTLSLKKIIMEIFENI